MSFIPDKFVLLEEKDLGACRKKILEGLRSEDGAMSYPEDKVEEMAIKAGDEYHYHITGVSEVYKESNIVKVDCSHSQQVVLEDIARILRL